MLKTRTRSSEKPKKPVFGFLVEGFEDQPSVIDEKRNVKPGPLQHSDVRLGGFSVIDVENEEQTYLWAAKIAKSFRCPQEVREMIYDTESTN